MSSSTALPSGQVPPREELLKIGLSYALLARLAKVNYVALWRSATEGKPLSDPEAAARVDLVIARMTDAVRGMG